MSRIFYKALSLSLNSSSIDELGEGVYGNASLKQGTQVSTATQRETQRKYLVTSILTKASQEGRKGEGQNAAQMCDL